MNDETNEQWTLYSIIEYVLGNFIGLTLLISTFLIIYFVDNINQLNTILYTPQLPIDPIKIKPKSKKLKKH